jgi:hypothetical protein
MNADDLDRTLKILIDSGAASSVAEAEAIITNATLHVDIDPKILVTPPGQACLATIINAASRAFRGGITVSGLDQFPTLPGPGPLLLPSMHTLFKRASVPTPSASIAIGDVPARLGAIWVAAHGWTAETSDLPLVFDQDAWPVASIAAGALAVAEALQQLLGHPTAGRRRLRRSLWSPDGRHDDPTPNDTLHLPDDWWLVGLGHLGQGVLWSILHLEHPAPGLLQLQDTDLITPANLATGALTEDSLIGLHKTRALAHVAENAGWRTSLVERRMDDHHRATDRDPGLVIVGVDNYHTRRRLVALGADTLIDLGIGATPSSYDGIAMRVFPGRQRPDEITSWQSDPPPRTPTQAAYQAAVAAGELDDCGALLIAGIAVGAACVGLFAGALCVAEAVRRATGGPAYDHVDLQLRSTDPGVARASDARSVRFRTSASQYA